MAEHRVVGLNIVRGVEGRFMRRVSRNAAQAVAHPLWEHAALAFDPAGAWYMLAWSVQRGGAR